MTIGIDITSTQDQFKNRGIGRYTKNIVNELLNIDKNNRYLLFKFSDAISTLEHTFISYPNVKTIDVGPMTLSSPKNIFSKNIKRAVRKNNVDVFFCPNIERRVPFGKYKTMVMIHDIIPLSTNNFSGQGVIQNYLKRLWYKSNLKLALKADKIITNSEFSKEELLKFNPKIDVKVIYLGIESKFFNLKKEKITSVLSKYNIDFEYILYFGGIEKNKNVINLLKAFKLFKDSNPNDIKLVLVGKDFKEINKKENLDVQKFIKENNMDYIFYINFIEDNDLPYVIRGSRCYISIPYIEGFGLSALEASAVGIPLIASNIKVYKEILHNGAKFIECNNPKEIAEAIFELVNSDQKLLIQNEILNAKNYTWEKTAQNTLKEIQSLL